MYCGDGINAKMIGLNVNAVNNKAKNFDEGIVGFHHAHAAD